LVHNLSDFISTKRRRESIQMITRDMIVAEARLWVGTPYLHQSSCRGAGTDCLGLIRGVWRTLIGDEPETVPPYSADWSEPNHEEALLTAATRWLIPKDIRSTDLGDVLVFRMSAGSVAKHLGISSIQNNNCTVIHAYSGHSVIETSLSLPWAKRIVGRFEFPIGGL
jgi:NlpC/P60 family putative phage cell wall peptidase